MHSESHPHSFFAFGMTKSNNKQSFMETVESIYYFRGYLNSTDNGEFFHDEDNIYFSKSKPSIVDEYFQKIEESAFEIK